jgi:hypothetical protein
MRRHHDALAMAFAEIPPAWGPLAEVLDAIGLKIARGKQPSATTARQTWCRVRNDVARARQLEQATTPTLAPDEIAPGVHLVASGALGKSPFPEGSREDVPTPSD